MPAMMDSLLVRRADIRHDVIRQIKEFDAFAADKTVEEVEALLEHGGTFAGEATKAAMLWAARQRAWQAQREESLRTELELRNVQAAERSAESARTSARASWIAVGISLAALALAAWPLTPWS